MLRPHHWNIPVASTYPPSIGMRYSPPITQEHYGIIMGQYRAAALLKKAKFPPLRYTPGSGSQAGTEKSPIEVTLGERWNMVE